MAKFTADVDLNIRWQGHEFIGVAGSTHRVTDALVEEFEAQVEPQIPGGITWLDQDEVGSITTPSIVVSAETTLGIDASAGTATSYARGDHTHGTPPASIIPSASTSVASETSYGISSSAGTATAYARGDHTHGTPALPTQSGSGNFTIPSGSLVVTSGNVVLSAGSVAIEPGSVRLGGDVLISRGTTNQLHLADGDYFAPRWPGCLAVSTSSTSLANNAWTAVALDSETDDPFGMHSPSVNNSRITVPWTGWYRVTGSISIAPASGGTRRLVGIGKNGDTPGTAEQNGVLAASGFPTLAWPGSISIEMSLAAGDYVELMGFQNSGGVIGGEGTLAVTFLGRSS